MLLELKRLRDPRIIVRTSNEPVTGADMDWWFVSSDLSQHICLSVQAKILNYERVNSQLWAYPDIRHPGTGGQQARRLRLYASRQSSRGRATYPLYLFYNPASADMSGMPPCAHPKGVTLANGYRIVAHLERNRVGNNIAIDATRLTELAPMMFCLPVLFCRTRDTIPKPDDVIGSLEFADERLLASTGSELKPLSRRPTSGEGVPPEIVGLIERFRSEAMESDDPDDRKGRDRNTIVFISDR